MRLGCLFCAAACQQDRWVNVSAPYKLWDLLVIYCCFAFANERYSRDAMNCLILEEFRFHFNFRRLKHFFFFFFSIHMCVGSLVSLLLA